MKKVLLIGATGLLGSNIARALDGKAEVLPSSHSEGEYSVDISNPESIKTLFNKVGFIDSIICTAGLANFVEWGKASDEDWRFAIENKMMGQINIIRYGEAIVKKGGAIVLTTGVLAQHPIPGSAIVSSVNAAVEAAIRSAALETSGKVRINAVSPGWVSETMEAMGLDPEPSIPAREVANYFVKQMETGESGSIAVAAK